jgi:hypothetical protein
MIIIIIIQDIIIITIIIKDEDFDEECGVPQIMDVAEAVPAPAASRGVVDLALASLALLPCTRPV